MSTLTDQLRQQHQRMQDGDHADGTRSVINSQGCDEAL